MTITINTDTLRRWWPSLLPAFLAAWHKLSPSVSAWVSQHPDASVWYAAAAIFIATLIKSPLPSMNGLYGKPDSLATAIAKAKAGK